MNAELTQELGIPQAAAVTCVKPSGTVSQLVDSASGIHPRHSAYYIRRVRCNKDDPLTTFMREHGVPMEDCVMNPASTAVFSFPIKAPDGECSHWISACLLDFAGHGFRPVMVNSSKRLLVSQVLGGSVVTCLVHAAL